MKYALPIFLLALVGRIYAGHCGGDSAIFRIMPPTLGGDHGTLNTPVELPCDSMIVPVGKTTTIHASSMVHFGVNPSPTSKICVKGTLRVLGEPDHPVCFSASVRQTPVGYAPGIPVWDGIEVDSGGAVDFRYARLFNAPTAMTFFSRNVVMVHTYFQGSSGLILPDSNLFLNTHGTTLDTLDLRKKIAPAATAMAHPPAKGLNRNGAGSSGKKIAWYAAAGVGVLAASGLVWYALRPESPSSGGSKLDPTNFSFPDTVNPRQ